VALVLTPLHAALRRIRALTVHEAEIAVGALRMVFLHPEESEAGEDAEAEKEYREAERINPNNGQVLMEMAKMLTSQGDLMEALTRLTRAVELMPSAAAVHYQIGVLYRRLGRTDEAERHLNAFRQLQADKAQQSGSAAK